MDRSINGPEAVFVLFITPQKVEEGIPAPYGILNTAAEEDYAWAQMMVSLRIES